MKILLYSKSNFIKDELKKGDSFFKDLVVSDNLRIIEKEMKYAETLVILHHLNDFKDDIEYFIKQIQEYKNIYLIALSNTPTNLEGCKLLRLGYKSYLHSISNYQILKSAIESVITGNIYLYPELMQFLISQVGITQENKKDKNLDILTPKEMEVLKLISKGYSNSKISKELNIAEITVKKHIGSMFQKLDVKDRLSLALILK
ncbi:response regulator transcription factor [Aliarcobacter skirrowii]|jgi:DNA-binding NarL/FixJ family response regulator|uniref:Response regulator transcription factor n=1 Tax=Aliarcobacter skirrowii TaxID=28200 RepID=A0AAW9D7D8_9BACT|nr:response regulator transcription factor [Aliarcobacter skirrowii]MDX4068158.1 response regulator transcription factor [Aliarcobacter skirrowii]